ADTDRASRAARWAAISRHRGPRRLGGRGGTPGPGVPPELRQQRLLLRQLHPLERRARYVVHVDRATHRPRRSGRTGTRDPKVDYANRTPVYDPPTWAI